MTNKNKMPLSYEMGKLPPQNIELEEAVIGGVMLEKEAIEDIVNILTPESFYKNEHSLIFQSVLNLYNKNKPIDILTITQDLRECKTLEEVGGPAYLTNLTFRIASAAHIEFHARSVQQKFLAREIIRIASEIQNKAFDESIDVNDLIDYGQEQFNIIANRDIKKEGRFIYEISQDRIKELSKMASGEIKSKGVNAGKKINDATGGWHPGNLILIGARPGIGKTRVAQEILERATENGDSAGLFSLEMTDTEIADRGISSKSGIENTFIRKAKFNEEDWDKIDLAQTLLENQNILIDDTPCLKISEFRSKARLYKKKHDLKLIVVDYIQLMVSPEHGNFRERELSYISSQLKMVAKELDIPIIALCQLNRDLEKRTDKRPMLSDLRESGALEQDADIVIFLYRPEMYGFTEDENGSTKNRIELIYAKHRHGAVGIINWYRTNSWTEISDYTAYESENENPFE